MANLDRFGQAFTVVGCRDKKGKGFASGIVELKGQKYKIEPSRADKDGVDYWVRITKLDPKKKVTL